jgi:hypothetical protein
MKMHRQFQTAAALVIAACCAGAEDPNLDVPQAVTTVWTQLQFIEVGDINAVEQSFYADFYATVRSDWRQACGWQAGAVKLMFLHAATARSPPVPAETTRAPVGVSKSA